VNQVIDLPMHAHLSLCIPTFFFHVKFVLSRRDNSDLGHKRNNSSTTRCSESSHHGRSGNWDGTISSICAGAISALSRGQSSRDNDHVFWKSKLCQRLFAPRGMGTICFGKSITNRTSTLAILHPHGILEGHILQSVCSASNRGEWGPTARSPCQSECMALHCRVIRLEECENPHFENGCFCL